MRRRAIQTKHYEQRRVRAATAALLRQLGLEAVGAYHHQNGRCVWCKELWGRNPEVDHHLPVSRGGAETIENLRVLCRSCNQRKGAQHPDTFDPFIAPVASPSSPTQAQIKRSVVFDAQAGQCHFCGQGLGEVWELTRSLRGVCTLCHERSRRMSPLAFGQLLAQDLL